jgi:hypothetical protein
VLQANRWLAKREDIYATSEGVQHDMKISVVVIMQRKVSCVFWYGGLDGTLMPMKARQVGGTAGWRGEARESSWMRTAKWGELQIKRRFVVRI